MKNLFYQVCILFVFLFLSGCLGTRFLKEDEKLLYKQNIEDHKGLDKEKLESFYQAKPNSRIPLLNFSPYVFIYQMGAKKYNLQKYENKKSEVREKYQKKIADADDELRQVQRYQARMNKKLAKLDKTIKEGNLYMRWGEPLAVYDSTLQQRTLSQLELYLHSSGYFNAEVHYIPEVKKKLVSITYLIEKSEPFIIDSLLYDIPDPSVSNLVKENQDESLLKLKTTYDQQNLSNERDRLYELLVNNGYYDFSRQYITFEVDSSLLSPNKVVIKTIIQNPPSYNQHQIFTIDSVFFTTDSDVRGFSGTRFRENYNDVIYRYYVRQYAKKIIDWRLFIHPGNTYSREKTLETQRQLSNLDTYKFINIKYDTVGGKFIANIFTSPQRKYQTSTEVGVNVSQGLPGPFVNASLKVRNVFRGLESLSLSGRFGIEGVASATEQSNVYSSVEYGTNLSLSFPQFLFPLGKTLKSKLGAYNPRTRLTSGINYTDRPEYLRTNINTRIDYNWQQGISRQFTFTPGDFSFIDSQITTPFDSLLNVFAENGNNLRNSFLPSFVSSTSAAVVYNFNNYGNKKVNSSYLRLFVESGGMLLSMLQNPPFGDNLEYYQWVKLSADYRAIKPIQQQSAVAFRVHGGVAYSYGDNETLPYEKFFFAGGSNSLRAWRPRRLGPGSYQQTDNRGNTITSFEQPGDIILETSVEYRHKIAGFVHGAVFLDAGNVWTIREDQNRPGAKFEAESFLREIAVGAGYGLRFDFSFLILRFDAAVKMYDPSRDNGAFIWQPDTSPFTSNTNRREITLNIGIGHPF